MVLHVKEFPPDLHRELKAAAAKRGISLRAYVILTLTEVVDIEDEVSRSYGFPPKAGDA